MLAVARGDAEVSICLHGREKEWDTCAPGLIVSEAGGRVSDIDGARFVYNRPDVAHRRGILMTNGHLHDRLRELAAPFFAA
jgi:3'(2'), 5'-bisphosphate nucleotidase